MQSVAYTAVPMFSIAAVWFLGFGLCLMTIGVCYFCRKREPYGYSPTCYALSLILLILFTFAAVCVHISLLMFCLFQVLLDLYHKLHFSVLTGLDVQFSTSAREVSITACLPHCSTWYIKLIPLWISLGTCQIILLRLNRLESIEFFSPQMFKLILMRQKQISITLLAHLLTRQKRTQTTYKIS